MRPGIGKKPSGILKYLILRDFGSLDALSKEIQNAALTQFGSGWVWLACELRATHLFKFNLIMHLTPFFFFFF